MVVRSEIVALKVDYFHNHIFWQGLASRVRSKEKDGYSVTRYLHRHRLEISIARINAELFNYFTAGRYCMDYGW